MPVRLIILFCFLFYILGIVYAYEYFAKACTDDMEVFIRGERYVCMPKPIDFDWMKDD